MGGPEDGAWVGERMVRRNVAGRAKTWLAALVAIDPWSTIRAGFARTCRYVTGRRCVWDFFHGWFLALSMDWMSLSDADAVNAGRE